MSNATVISSPVVTEPNMNEGGSTLNSVILKRLDVLHMMVLSALSVQELSISIGLLTPAMVRLPMHSILLPTILAETIEY